MRADQSEISALEAPLAQLERALIEEFVRARTHNRVNLSDLPEHERTTLLKDASVYASARLAEIESRSQIVQDLHGGVPAVPKPDR
jgi:hypothetical protein